jgi:hypothetical protein
MIGELGGSSWGFPIRPIREAGARLATAFGNTCTHHRCGVTRPLGRDYSAPPNYHQASRDGMG